MPDLPVPDRNDPPVDLRRPGARPEDVSDDLLGGGGGDLTPGDRNQDVSDDPLGGGTGDLHRGRGTTDDDERDPVEEPPIERHDDQVYGG